MASVRVPGFLPSTNGFAFPNAWPSNPIRQFRLGNVATLNIGDAANGLCGGMSFAVADLFRAGLRPGDQPIPAGGSPRHAYIVERQVSSFDDGRVPLRFYALMSPARTEREGWLEQVLGRVGIDHHSRTWTMLQVEWPRIRARLEAGELVVLGLVRVVSLDPSQLARNHQVLAYGYDHVGLAGPRRTLHLYDPNRPTDDRGTLALDLSDPTRRPPVLSFPAGPTVLAFFRVPYTARTPP